MNAPDPFLDEAEPVLGIAAVAIQPVPMIVLVVDDSQDDELVSVIAAAKKVPADDFGGGWGSRVFPQVAARFTLERLSGGFIRRWILPGLDDQIIEISQQPHYVAVLPKELAGDLSQFTDVSRLGGAIIAAVHPTVALVAARAAGL
jgi:hypothetical protein